VEHEEGDHEAKGEDEVGKWACDADDHALPSRVGGEIAGIDGVFFAWIFAGHFDVSAKGQGADAVIRLSDLDAEEAGTESYGKDLDANAAKLGSGEMTKFMDNDHDSEDDDE
jgi:hypothetical protein